MTKNISLIILLLLTSFVCSVEWNYEFVFYSSFTTNINTAKNYGYKNIKNVPDAQPYKITHLNTDSTGKYTSVYITPTESQLNIINSLGTTKVMPIRKWLVNDNGIFIQEDLMPYPTDYNLITSTYIIHYDTVTK